MSVALSPLEQLDLQNRAAAVASARGRDAGQVFEEVGHDGAEDEKIEDLGDEYEDFDE